jgi:long-chain acyl-CoA synthetase
LNDNLLPALAKVIDNCPTVKSVIYDGDKADSKAIEKIKAANEGIRVLTLDELRDMGKKQKFDPVPPKEDGEWDGS